MKKKIKYQGGITKILCQQRANYNKRQFNKNLPKIDITNSIKPQKVGFDVISFSGAASFEDQVLSIFSFLIYAGTPVNWTIYSDGSYTAEQIQLFKSKFHFVSVEQWDKHDLISDNKLLGDYLKVCHLAKKLNVIMGHPYHRQTIYMDSDVIFYKNIAMYIDSGLLSAGLWYAPDTMWNNVEHYFKKQVTSIYPLNSGLLFLNENFNSADIWKYLESLKGHYGYFSEQSAFEYAFRKQDADILDPRQFVIDSSDQFNFSIKYQPADIAMRHYTTPVRHKIWQNGWEWNFKP